MTKEEIADDNKATVFFNEALNGIKTYAEKNDECNKKYCKDCEFFIYTSSVLNPDKLHIRCNKTNQFRVVDLEHTVKPEDFYEEEK
jgi:hypothetical protein